MTVSDLADEDKSDVLPVLRTFGPRVCKTYRRLADGQIKKTNAAMPKWFQWKEKRVADIDHLGRVLKTLEPMHDVVVVRGAKLPAADQHRMRRLLNDDLETGDAATFQAAGRRYVSLDIDGLSCPIGIDPVVAPEAAVEYAISNVNLPVEFLGATCWWQFSNSQCFKEGRNLNLHLWFWLSRSTLDEELKAWLAEAAVDPAFFNPVQMHFTANPFLIGVADPLPRRSGLRRGAVDVVSVPDVILPSGGGTTLRIASTGGTGLPGGVGYEEALALIGDEASGGAGFLRPIKRAIAAAVRAADDLDSFNADALAAELEPVIRSRDLGHRGKNYPDERVADLPSLIGWTIAQERASRAKAEAIERVEPTYPAVTATLEEARATMAAAVSAWSDAATDYWVSVGQHGQEVERLKADPKLDLFDPLPEPPTIPVHAVVAGVGLGKSHDARYHSAFNLSVANLFDDGPTCGVIAVPRHRLADEQAAALRELPGSSGLRVETYRGRGASDPERPGNMCGKSTIAEKITAAGGDVETVLCGSKKQSGERCEFFNTCGYRRQMDKSASIWIIPHQLLFHPKPKMINAPRFVVIDENFTDAGLKGFGKPYVLFFDELTEPRTVPAWGKDDPKEGTTDEQRAAAKLERERRSAEATAMLARWSRAAAEAVESGGKGKVAKARLEAAGFHGELCRELRRLELRLKRDMTSRPANGDTAAEEEAKSVAADNGPVFRRARFWALCAELLDSRNEVSPHLTFDKRKRKKDDDDPRGVVMQWREDVHESWSAPTLILDATMNKQAVQAYFPTLDRVTEVQASQPHVRVRQVRDKPFSGAMLIESEKAKARKNGERSRNVDRVRRYIEVRAAEFRGMGAGDVDVLVICQKNLEEALSGGSLFGEGVLLHDGRVLPRVSVEHYNNISGLDCYGGVACVILIGRTLPSAGGVEDLAEVTMGRIVERLPTGDWYPRAEAGLRMRDGSGVRVETERHPDATVEAFRWGICEAQLIQALGRGRGVNRTAENPLQIDLLNNMPLPGLEVDEALTWDEAQPSLADLMVARGVLVSGHREIAAVLPDVCETAEAVRARLKRNCSEWTLLEGMFHELSKRSFAYKDSLLIGIRPLAKFAQYYYANYKRRDAYLDPSRHTHPAAALRAVLGEDAVVEIPGDCPGYLRPDGLWVLPSLMDADDATYAEHPAVQYLLSMWSADELRHALQERGVSTRAARPDELTN